MSRFVGTATMTGLEAFYSTICHELVHHSGAPHRLNREKGKRFCDRAYCFEELIATLGEAFLCVELGITPTEREDHAQYIGQYVQMMKADNRVIFQAASAAAKTSEFILAVVKQMETRFSRFNRISNLSLTRVSFYVESFTTTKRNDVPYNFFPVLSYFWRLVVFEAR